MAERHGPIPREDAERQQEEFVYRPPTNLPDPKPHDGYEFRWVRVSLNGEKDDRNAMMRLREGWEPVKAEDHPEFFGVLSDSKEGSICIGGLMLCKASTEAINARKRYFNKQASMQMQSVDNNFMRENDARMPLLKPERSTQVSFGRGRAPTRS